MDYKGICCCILLSLTYLTIGFTFVIDSGDSDLRKFYSFLETYNKTYGNDPLEFNKRFSIFKKSLERHDKLNSKRKSTNDAWFGVNAFSDLTPEEFATSYLTKYQSQSCSSSSSNTGVYEFHKSRDDSANLTQFLKKFDWRSDGVIGKVRNQGSCGACWAFSIVETAASMFAIKHGGPPPVLSPQELIDCSYPSGGCQGGDTEAATKWLVDNHIPLVKEETYPYQEQTETCHLKPESGVQVTSYQCLRLQGQESVMLSLLSTHGPLSVAVDAETWHDYMGGIIQYHCDGFINHAVQIVGYDTTGPVPFYIVRNQWGTTFGDNGYLYIKIGGNICGITHEVIELNVL